MLVCFCCSTFYPLIFRYLLTSSHFHIFPIRGFDYLLVVLVLVAALLMRVIVVTMSRNTFCGEWRYTRAAAGTFGLPELVVLVTLSTFTIRAKLYDGEACFVQK